MAQFITKLKSLKSKISIPSLIFLIFIIVGCLYQVIQVTEVYFRFETKVDLTYYDTNQFTVPIVSFCRDANKSFKNTSIKSTKGMSTDQIINKTYNFGDFIINMYYIVENGVLVYIKNFSSFEMNSLTGKRNKTKYDIQFEKVIFSTIICYNLKHPQTSLSRSLLTDGFLWNIDIVDGGFAMHLLPQSYSPHDLSSNSFITLEGNNKIYFFSIN